MNLKHNPIRKRAFTLAELIVVLVTIGILAAILWPTFQRTHCEGSDFFCRTQLKQLGLVMKIYRADYNDHFPSLRTSQGWNLALREYVKLSDASLFRCPLESRKRPHAPKHSTDYWFNSQLSEVAVSKIVAPASTVMLAEGYGSSKARIAFDSIPPNWLEETDSPLYRHWQGSNFAFADGHVKLLKASQLRPNSSDTYKMKFVIR